MDPACISGDLCPTCSKQLQGCCCRCSTVHALLDNLWLYAVSFIPGQEKGSTLSSPSGLGFRHLDLVTEGCGFVTAFARADLHMLL